MIGAGAIVRMAHLPAYARRLDLPVAGIFDISLEQALYDGGCIRRVASNT